MLIGFPKRNTLTFDITYVTYREAACLLMNFYIVWNFHTMGTQRPFSAQFLGRRKYCLEISKTWERLVCLRSSSARMKIEIAGIYWLEANIGNSLLFLLTYLRFWEVQLFKFYYQYKMIIVKKGFHKTSV